MSEVASPRLSLPFLTAGQAQKEMTHNEALQMLDAIVQPVAESADVSSPPASPEIGAAWIVAADPGGAWAGRAGAIAQWTAGGWRFFMPGAGWRCHIMDRNGAMLHDGTAWRDEVARPGGIYINGQKVVGERLPAIPSPAGGTSVDNEARAVIDQLLAALRTHGLLSS